MDSSTGPGQYVYMYKNLPESLVEMKEMETWQLELLDKIAEFLKNPDRNLDRLRSLQMAYKQLQGLQSAWPIFAQTVYK